MATNHLLKFSTIPNFRKITAAQCAHAITHVIEELEAYRVYLSEIKAISWESYWLPYVQAIAGAERVRDQLSFMTAINSTLMWKHLSDRLEYRYSEVVDAIHAHPNFVAGLVKLSKKRLSKKQRSIINFELSHHRRNGALLAAADRKCLEGYQEQLSILEDEFYSNYISALADKKYFICVRREAVLGEMPADIKSIYRKGRNSWVFDMTNDSYGNFMKYCLDRGLRKKMYYNYHTLCSERDVAHDNVKVMRKIARLRQKKARILGYANSTEMMFSIRRGQTAPKIKNFLNSILREVRGEFKRELRQVSSAIYKELGITTPQLWDVDIINQKLRGNRYHNHGEEFREYFELENVLVNMLKLAERVYGIKFKKYSIEGWGKDIRYFKVFDAKDNRPLGIITFDLLRRKNKDCMTYCQGSQHGTVNNGHHQLAVTNVVMNLLAPADNTPILLNLDDLSNLFHETGHAIHDICLVHTNYEFPVHEYFFSDELEMPSQFFERFVCQWKFMKEFGRHYLYDKPIPKKLFDSATGCTFSLLRKQSLLEYIRFALFELEANERDEDILEIFRRVNKKCNVLSPPHWNRHCARFAAGFTTLSGGVACNYYGYLWSEMYAADLCDKFLRHKNLASGALGRRFRKEFLEYRFPRSLNQAFTKFMGRPVNPRACLEFYSAQHR